MTRFPAIDHSPCGLLLFLLGFAVFEVNEADVWGWIGRMDNCGVITLVAWLMGHCGSAMGPIRDGRLSVRAACHGVDPPRVLGMSTAGSLRQEVGSSESVFNRIRRPDLL